MSSWEMPPIMVHEWIINGKKKSWIMNEIMERTNTNTHTHNENRLIFWLSSSSSLIVVVVVWKIIFAIEMIQAYNVKAKDCLSVIQFLLLLFNLSSVVIPAKTKQNKKHGPLSNCMGHPSPFSIKKKSNFNRIWSNFSIFRCFQIIEIFFLFVLVSFLLEAHKIKLENKVKKKRRQTRARSNFHHLLFIFIISENANGVWIACVCVCV